MNRIYIDEIIPLLEDSEPVVLLTILKILQKRKEYKHL